MIEPATPMPPQLPPEDRDDGSQAVCTETLRFLPKYPYTDLLASKGQALRLTIQQELLDPRSPWTGEASSRKSHSSGSRPGGEGHQSEQPYASPFYLTCVLLASSFAVCFDDSILSRD